jgi:lipoprotein-anchoring transpeptidase ErfK/SrfK
VAPGTIVVSVSQRRLFLVQNDGTTISYPVAVPKHGKEWFGVTSIREKFTNPDWTPPADVRADHPELPEMISGGAPNNPMGTRAMLLDGDQVAIHGTTSKMRASIGTAASYGLHPDAQRGRHRPVCSGQRRSDCDHGALIPA